jgi:hypothetical protein
LSSSCAIWTAARVAKGQAGEYKAVQALAAEHGPLLAGLRDRALTKSAALQVARWTRAIGEELRGEAEEIVVAVPEGHVTGLVGPKGTGKPVTELRHSLLARPADCRSPGQRSSSRTRPPSSTYCVRERYATRC